MKHTITLLALIASASFAQAQTISTVAGTGTGGYNGDGGSPTSKELSYPSAIAFDKAGNYYITDRNNNRVRMVSTSGIISTLAGNGIAGFTGDGGPATAAELNAPMAITVDKNGNVLIADQNNQRIRMVNTSGIITSIAGNGTYAYSGDGGQATDAELYNPWGVATDKSGNIYISDWGNDRIRIVNASGIINTFAGNGTAGLSGNGGQATAAELNHPTQISFDNKGNLYIADNFNHEVRKINTSNVMTAFAGNGTPGYFGDGGPATGAGLDYPTGVTIDSVGDVYISDQANQTIRIVKPSGIISIFAGNYMDGYTGNGGPATAAEINFPCGLAVDATGRLYISDEENNVIRRITSITGIDEVQDNSAIRLYPNPNNGVFTIERSAEKQSEVVEVYNMLGEKVYTTRLNNEATQMDLSNNANGVYLYRIITLDGKPVSEGKFIKQ